MKRSEARRNMILSMVIFGTLGLFVRHIDLSSGELALYRAIMASLLLGGVMIFGKRRFSKKPADGEPALLFLSGAAMGVNWILLFEAYRYTTVSVATLSYYFAPVIVMAVCPILFREKPSWQQVLCFVMSTIGILLITGLGDTEEKTTHFTGVIFGLGAAVCYACVMLLNKKITGTGGICRTFYQFLAAVAVLLPYVALRGQWQIRSLDASGWGCLLVVGFVHTGLTYCLYFSALKDLSGQEAAILSYIDPLTAVAVSVLLLSEKLGIFQLIGGALILGFTLWNEWSHTKENQAAE